MADAHGVARTYGNPTAKGAPSRDDVIYVMVVLCRESGCSLPEIAETLDLPPPPHQPTPRRTSQARGSPDRQARRNREQGDPMSIHTTTHQDGSKRAARRAYGTGSSSSATTPTNGQWRAAGRQVKQSSDRSVSQAPATA